MEEDLVDTHHNVIQTMQNWVQEDSQLISMTQEVDYDQDGRQAGSAGAGASGTP